MLDLLFKILFPLDLHNDLRHTLADLIDAAVLTHHETFEALGSPMVGHQRGETIDRVGRRENTYGSFRTFPCGDGGLVMCRARL